MRPLLVLMLAVFAATALGCQESGFDERKETAQPLKVQHVLGETKVPGQAERPLTLSVDALDDTLALGVTPVRSAMSGGAPPAYLRRAARNVKPMRPLTERADTHTVRASKPDVILGNEADQGRFYERLTLIAPTVMTEGGSGQWKLNLRLIGEALGRTNDAEALLSEYDRLSGRLRRSLRSRPPLRVAVVRAARGRLRVATRDSFAGTVLTDVGLRQVTRPRAAEVTLVAEPRASGDRPASGGRLPGAARVDEALWWGPGGFLAGRAAVVDLQRILER